MVKIEMWYGDLASEADKIDIAFYPNECRYRGNIYKGSKIIGDYYATDSVKLEKAFPQLVFNWGKAKAID